VALQQQRGSPTTRSSVGSVTTLSNLLRMLYSRAGDYPKGQALLYAESFSPNTAEGACPKCHGLGRIYDVTEQSMVPDPSKTIRERAIAAWPMAWGGQNQRDIAVTMGIDVDIPWRDLPKKDRDFLLFSEEQPVVPVYPGYTPAETRRALKRKEEPGYMGTFTSARRHVLSSFANTESPLMKKRAMQYMINSECTLCHGKRLKREALSVKFAGLDITEMSRLPLKRVATLFAPYAEGKATPKMQHDHPEQATVVQRIAEDLVGRIGVILDLGLGYLTLERSTPTLSPGELQRLRLATQVKSNLFGVVYVLDEPSAGLHPADTESLLRALGKLKAAGNSLFVVEHEVDVMRAADWIVDVGPGAGEKGGRILYSGPLEGLKAVEASQTRRYLFAGKAAPKHQPIAPKQWLKLEGVTRNNLEKLDVDVPIGVLTAVTGISGSGKSSLISQAMVELVAARLGHAQAEEEEVDLLERETVIPTEGRVGGDMDRIKRLVVVDQKPIGRTPRSNLATYTGLFDHVRKLFAATRTARARRYDAGRFSFNVAKGRCENCRGEGWVMVELLFLPSVYAPCPVCQGTRYNPQTLEIKYKDKNIAEVLGLRVDEAATFFEEEPSLARALAVVQEVGLGYLRLGQPATELSGGEAQRIKLATELQRIQHGNTLYVLDEPTTGLHPSDVVRLIEQLRRLVEAGNTVVVVEHDMSLVAAADWVIDIGPGSGDEGGKLVAAGPPAKLAAAKGSHTAGYLAKVL
jgi:excinuclease ABC subunit A